MHGNKHVSLRRAGCLSADQIIAKAVPAINAVNTFHFTLSTSKVQKAPPGIFITGVDGDVQKPDKLVGSVTAAYSGIPVKINVVVDGSSQFLDSILPRANGDRCRAS